MMKEVNCKECEYYTEAPAGVPHCVKRDFDIYNVTYGSCLDFKKESQEDKPLNIISQIGTPAALEQLAEECCELGQAAMKMARKLRGENPTPKTLMECQESLQEELGDVLLCIELIRTPDILGSDDCIDEGAKLKLERWKERLKENTNGQS